ncbi:excinuclease ABC subunit UvrC [Acholeplasma equirhinis]|uniref:excinuclease ABC subunit UvrC n=1 Tax=Acholeplasma equirhinis TaxID=555393 RepID=UPI00197AE1A3|nr:excinuclease ABC subunit UvrC [Acholeplasma equirhinis]MBN3490702.1 excinuclease ABC subunit UvrC [Acholeplasma equirhinis]
MKEKLALLPTEPGCYMMLNEAGDVIYVGKAKNLKNRVKSYFTGSHNAKTQKLVSEIRDFNYVVTNSETESLLLEFNLIKKHAPIYNIRLIDDKSYPYIEITNEKDPMLVVSRYQSVDKDRKLFGPFPNAYSAKETVKLLQKLYPLRRCNPIGKKPCMYYHLGLCLGPCAHEHVDYQPNIKRITQFLKGDTKEVLDELKERMKASSEALEFEKALEYRDMIRAVEATTEKQIVSLNDYKDRDFISFAANEDDLAIHILMMRQGRIFDSHQQVLSFMDDPKETFLSYLKSYYERFLLPDELVFDQQIDIESLKVYFGQKVTVPKIGDKKKLIDLAHKNAIEDLTHYFKLYRLKSEKMNEQMESLSNVVGRTVNYIEVFDNAHLFGTAPISGMIVWKDNHFERKMYRKFHLKTSTNDDYQSMKEVLYRRFQRLLIEKQRLPDLVCVDGGKPQVSAATEVLSELSLDVPILGLKKNKFHQLEGYVFNGEVTLLDKKDVLFQFLGKLSEEVHRFTITFHQDTKNRKDYTSVLDSIPGLGPTRKKKLLTQFKSIDEIKGASVEALREIGLPDKVIKAIKEGLS